MALTKFTDNVEIIQALSNTPNATEGLTADQLKAKFDDAANKIKTYLNDTLTEEIDVIDTAVSDKIDKTAVVDSLTSTSATDPLSANQGKILNESKIPNDGWSSANETWAYLSVDDPTGVITISGDKTTKYSVGMRIKFTNGGNVIYGIITAISYSSPNTTLTFLHEIDPTDSLALHLMANSAITANYYSSMKAPFGFPTNPNKWSVTRIITGGQTTTPTSGGVYYLGSNSVTLPIGSFDFSYSTSQRISNGGGLTDRILAVYISDSSSTLVNVMLLGKTGSVGNYYSDTLFSGVLSYLIATKITKYLVLVPIAISTAADREVVLSSAGYLKATCAYL